MEKSFHSIRKQYIRGILLEDQAERDPLKQMKAWLEDAFQAECPEPTAMVLSTTGHDLKPSSRVVLMKGLDDKGFTFFTNYDSPKGQHLQENPQASLLFFWPCVERQVRIEGTVSKVSEEESDAYFNSRPEASRISAIISPQSREIPNREWLESVAGTYNYAHPGIGQLATGSRPQNWGGYRLVPEYFEFWQGREDRLHDRIAYQFEDPSWRISRLAP